MSTNKAEQAVAYAALILADENITITPEKLQTLLRAAGIEDIEPIWTTLFANALKNKNVKGILTTVTVVTPVVGGEEGSGKEKADDGKDGSAENGKDEPDGIDLDVDSDDDGGFIDLFA